MANNNEVVVCEGIVADTAAALADPDGFEVTHCLLGWTLNALGSDFSTLISEADALRIIRAQRSGRPVKPSSLEAELSACVSLLASIYSHGVPAGNVVVQVAYLKAAKVLREAQ